MLYTFVDTETSGLEVSCDILSFSYMIADEKLHVKSAEVLYFWKEGVTKWTEEAYAIHGLSKEFLRQYEDQYEANLRKMYIVLSYAFLVGYNSGYYGTKGLLCGFDYPRCKDFLIRNGLYEPTPAAFYDVMQIDMTHNHKRSKLSTVFQKSGIPEAIAQAYSTMYFGSEGRAHESAYDTIMTALLFKKFYEEGYAGTGAEVESTGEAIDFANRDTEYWRLRFNDTGLYIYNYVDDTSMSVNEFGSKFPELLKKMQADPNKYMYKED